VFKAGTIQNYQETLQEKYITDNCHYIAVMSDNARTDFMRNPEQIPNRALIVFYPQDINHQPPDDL
jgi:hypothetical protein